MKWPSELLIIRHGRSVANERKDASRKARAAGLTPESAWALTHERDHDTPLTPYGERQAEALGARLRLVYYDSTVPAPIDAIITSPYVRTRQTTAHILKGMGVSDTDLCLRPLPRVPEVVVEERVREIEFGVFDGLTREGIRVKYPEEAMRRERDGKYWFRPAGGESRPDVRLRCHSFIGTMARDYVGKRLLVVCHSVVVLAFRSLLERWGEEEYMKVDREDDVANCGLTRYVHNEKSGKLELVEYNTIIPVVKEAS